MALCEAVAGSMMLSKVNLTAAASSGVPSWNFTSVRSVSITDWRSSAMVQAVARYGVSFPALSE